MKKHPDYERLARKWQRCRDAAAGEAEIHAGGDRYLPRLAEESDTDFKKRIARTPFFNATRRTINGLAGMVFRKPPRVELPVFGDNVDAAGTPVETFAARVVEEALTVGRVGLFVDYPPAPDGVRTQADAESLGLRPAIHQYAAESIVNWRYSRINNSTVLSLAVLSEFAPVGDDEFSHDAEQRWRVLDLFGGAYRVRVFNEDERGRLQLLSETFPTMRGAPMPFIPFAFVGDGEPPLIDLVTLNLHHYQVSADYEHGCHFSGLPSLFISGLRQDDGTKVYLGGPTANALPDPAARAYMVEVAGEFNALRTNLQDKQAQMAILGARMLETQRGGVEAAETAAQHRKGEESYLAMYSSDISRSITRALTWMAQWASADGEVVFELNRDYVPVGLSAQELTALVGAWQNGAISHPTLFENLQRGEVIAPEVTFEKEQGRITQGV